MKQVFFEKYDFYAKHHPEHNNVYSLKLLENNIGTLPKKTSYEMALLGIWDNIEINLNTPFCEVYPVIEHGYRYDSEIRFYSQYGNQYFGEHLQTGKAACAALHGLTDNDGICIPEVVSLHVSNLRFDKTANALLPDADKWQQARYVKSLVQTFAVSSRPLLKQQQAKVIAAA